MRNPVSRYKTRATVNLLNTLVLASLLINPVAAADITFNARLELPLGSGDAFFGFSAGPDAGIYFDADDDASKATQMGVELRYGIEGHSAFLINGVPITRSLLLSVSDGGGSQTTENVFDWRLIPAAALGIGLIVLVATADDSSVSVCSGSNCPPEEQPPPEPETTDSSTKSLF
jgi:hypothetical protein